MFAKFAANFNLLMSNKEYGFRSDRRTTWDLTESLLTAMAAKITLLMYLNI